MDHSPRGENSTLSVCTLTHTQRKETEPQDSPKLGTQWQVWPLTQSGLHNNRIEAFPPPNSILSQENPFIYLFRPAVLSEKGMTRVLRPRITHWLPSILYLLNCTHIPHTERVHTCTLAFMHAHRRTYMHVYTYICTHVHTHVGIHERMHARTHVHTHITSLSAKSSPWIWMNMRLLQHKQQRWKCCARGGCPYMASLSSRVSASTKTTRKGTGKDKRGVAEAGVSSYGSSGTGGCL